MGTEVDGAAKSLPLKELHSSGGSQRLNRPTNQPERSLQKKERKENNDVAVRWGGGIL